MSPKIKSKAKASSGKVKSKSRRRVSETRTSMSQKAVPTTKALRLAVEITCAFTPGVSVYLTVYNAYYMCHQMARDDVNHGINQGLREAVRLFGTDESGFKTSASRVGRAMTESRQHPIGSDVYDKWVGDVWETQAAEVAEVAAAKLELDCIPGVGSIFQQARSHFYEIAVSMRSSPGIAGDDGDGDGDGDHAGWER